MAADPAATTVLMAEVVPVVRVLIGGVESTRSSFFMLQVANGGSTAERNQKSTNLNE
jgi:hypothetical protein